MLGKLREVVNKVRGTEEQPPRQKGEQELAEDCLGCRLVGVGTFSGLGAYALYQQWQIPKTRVLHRVTVGVMSAAFFSVAVARALI